MTTPQNQKLLESAMDEIKAILVKHDLAAAIVLALPTETSHDTGQFDAVNYIHVHPSYSVAKWEMVKCCSEHEPLPSIKLSGEIDFKNPDAEGNRKIRITAGMFASLGKGTQNISNIAGAALQAFKTMLEKQIPGHPAAIHQNQKN